MRPSILILASGLLFSGLSSLALAQAAPTPKAQYAAASQEALARYKADKKLCGDETSSTARLQCRRDAKAEYDKALAAAKAQLSAAQARQPAAQVAAGKASAVEPACPDCARVLAVTASEKAGEGSALGMIAGGAAGAVLGHQVGGGFGKDLATVAGAVGGAYAGKKIEEKAKTHTVWTVRVQYDSGSQGSFEFDKDPGFKAGELVRKSDNTLVRR